MPIGIWFRGVSQYYILRMTNSQAGKWAYGVGDDGHYGIGSQRVVVDLIQVVRDRAGDGALGGLYPVQLVISPVSKGVAWCTQCLLPHLS